MHSKGQSGLDLLLALLVLLIVLNVFSSVLDRFEDVQKEISIRQQVRENLQQIHWLASYAGGYYYEAGEYPPTASLFVGSLLPIYLDENVRSTGITLLETVRAVGTQPGIPCSVDWDINASEINFHALVRGVDAGLTYDIDVNSITIIHSNYDDNHSFNVAGCFDAFSIEVKP